MIQKPEIPGSRLRLNKKIKNHTIGRGPGAISFFNILLNKLKDRLEDPGAD